MTFELLISTIIIRMARTVPVSPTTVSRECLYLGLKRASRAMARGYGHALRPGDLNNGQFSILTTIAGLQPAGMQTIAEQLAMDRNMVRCHDRRQLERDARRFGTRVHDGVRTAGSARHRRSRCAVCQLAHAASGGQRDRPALTEA